jgi:hypothetical protein
MIRAAKTHEQRSERNKEMAAATKWKSFIAEFVKSQFSRSKRTPEALLQKGFADIRSLHGAGGDEVFAQSTTSPWTQGMQGLKRPPLAPLPLALCWLRFSWKD